SNGNRLSGDFELGSPFSFGAEAGAIFSNGLRLSVDLAYYSVDPEQANIAFAPGAAQTPNVLAGDISGFMGFANIGYEYQDFGNFRPFLIAGLGFVSAELENVRAPLGPLTGIANSSDTQFAGKLGFGAAYELFDNFSLVGEYNYITTFDDMNLAFTAPGQTTPFAVESNTHRIHVGLRYSFGG
ncbi:MAG: outer membrane protein, partial [Devosiaceae bacterium]